MSPIDPEGMTMQRSPSVTYLVAVLGVALTSCGGTAEAPGADSAAIESTVDATTSSTAATTTSATTTSTSTSTVPDTATTVPDTATTVPDATASAVTTDVVTETGWIALDPESVSVKAFPPCCGDTWHGDVSPPVAEAEAAPADGPYPVTVNWPADLRRPLELQVARFEQCALLPDGECEPPGPGGYGADDLGVDDRTSTTVTVSLDGEVDVVVVGWDTEGRFEVERATGTELAALAAEVDQAYAEVFAQPVLDGREPSEMVAEVIERPRAGFGPGAGSIGAVAFTPADGPTLLFQAVYPYVDGEPTVGRGVDVLDVGSIEVADGRITLFVFAGYVP